MIAFVLPACVADKLKSIVDEHLVGWYKNKPVFNTEDIKNIMNDHFKVKSQFIEKSGLVEISIDYIQVGVDYPLHVDISINPKGTTRDKVIETITGWYQRAGINIEGNDFKRALIYLKSCITKALKI